MIRFGTFLLGLILLVLLLMTQTGKMFGYELVKTGNSSSRMYLHNMMGEWEHVAIFTGFYDDYEACVEATIALQEYSERRGLAPRDYRCDYKEN